MLRLKKGRQERVGVQESLPSQLDPVAIDREHSFFLVLAPLVFPLVDDLDATDRLYDDVWGAHNAGLRAIHTPHSAIPVNQVGHTEGQRGCDAAGGRLTAPMPGRIIAISATPGVRVERGAALLVMEAMKMEHTIVAPADGMIEDILFAVGDQVAEGAELVRFVPE